MDVEAIKQMAIDVNNVAETAFQSGKEHIERPLLAKIEQLQAENKMLKDALNRADNNAFAIRLAIEQALKGGE